MKILVIIVTFNAMRWAERCFDSLRKSTLKPDVFVVDNGSTDGTQVYIKEHYREVIFQQSEKNLRFGKANNVGLQYALDNNYDYVYLLNQDAWVLEDTFEKLIKISISNPEYGILSPFQMNADLYHIDVKFIKNVLNWNSNPDITNDMFNNQCKEVYPAKGVMAAHWLITRKCLMKIGGFSPSFSHYAEDYNYIDRVHYKGMKVGIVPSLRAVHDRGWREETIEQSFYQMYAGYIGIFSNPTISKKKSSTIVAFNALVGMLKYKSFKPLHNWIKVMNNRKTILKNREISINTECAFLDK